MVTYFECGTSRPTLMAAEIDLRGSMKRVGLKVTPLKRVGMSSKISFWASIDQPR